MALFLLIFVPRGMVSRVRTSLRQVGFRVSSVRVAEKHRGYGISAVAELNRNQRNTHV